MTKTLQVDEKLHILLIEKQLEYRKQGINKTLVEITNEIITTGLDTMKNNDNK